MATDLERLVISLEANINKLGRDLKKGGALLDDFDRDADAKTKRTAKKISDNLSKAFNDNAQGGLRGFEKQNLAYQVNDIVTGLASGQRPLQVLAQQGGQVYQILAGAQGGVTGALKSVAQSALGILTPARLVAGGVLGIAGAALFLKESWDDAQRSIKLGLTGIGAASGATVNDINRIAAAAAEGGRITVGSAREIATSLAATGKIGPQNIGSIVNLVPGFSKLTGSSFSDAGKELSKIFADPAKGADELNARLGVLDDKTRQYIITLSNQGDRQRAIAELARVAQPELEKAAQLTSIWAKAWDGVTSAASRTSNAVSGAFAGPGLEEQIARLKQQRDLAGKSTEGDYVDYLRKQGASEKQIKSLVPTYNPDAVKAYDEQIRKLTEDLEKQKKAAADDTATKQANALSIKAGEIVRTYDEAGQSIRKIEDDLAQLNKALADPKAAEGIAGGTDEARAKAEALRKQVILLKEDYAKGGAAASSALKQADFEKRVAGLSSYQRGLEEIKFKFEEMRRAAEAAGNTKALPTINAQEQAAVATYQTQTRQRAEGQTSIPSNIADIVIGAEGNNPAKNAKSSASGYGQFIDSTFITLYRKVFDDLASGLSDAQVLAAKANREVNVRLVQEYARQNAVTLNQAGFDSSNRNLYLSHFLGPQGAVSALQANPNANAQSVLGDAAAKANPSVFKNGQASVQDILNFAERRVQAYSQVGKAQQQAIIQTQQETQAYDQSAAAQAKLDAINQQLNADREAAGELGQRFATAEDLIKAKSDSLTPTLRAQRDAVLELASARSKAVETGMDKRFSTDLQNSYAALGRTSEEQSIYDRARQYAQPGTSQFDAATQGLNGLQEAANAKNYTGTFLKGLIADLQNGTKFSVALTNQLKRLAASLADKAIDKLLSSLFGGLGGGQGGGGILGGILGGGGLGSTGTGGLYAEGGHVRGPGSGTSDSIVARLSNGEFVVNAAQTSKFRPLLERINAGRYAEGGFVGRSPAISMPSIAMPRVAMAVPAGRSSPGTQFTFAPRIDARGADTTAVFRLQRQLDQMQQNLPKQIAGVSRTMQTRGTRP